MFPGANGSDCNAASAAHFIAAAGLATLGSSGGREPAGRCAACTGAAHAAGEPLPPPGLLYPLAACLLHALL